MKHDISSNWAKAKNFTPKDGQIIIYDDLNMIKIGNGIDKVNDLPFSSGKTRITVENDNINLTDLPSFSGVNSPELNQSEQNKTYTFATKDTYVDKDISINVNVSNGSCDLAGGSVSGGELLPGDGNVQGSNLILSTIDSSGISVTGSGSVHRNKITRAAITQSITAGWIDKVNDIEESSIEGQTKSSNGETKYITGVTLPNSKSFSIDDGVYNWTWSKDSSGNVTIY